VIHLSLHFFLTTPRLLILRHYRAACEGWNDCDDCDRCVQFYQDALLLFSLCQMLAAANCSCSIYLHQPPSQRDLCLHAVNNGSNFELTIHTIFDEYKLALKTGRVPLALSLLPQYFNIHIRCRFGSSSYVHRYHIRYPLEEREEIVPWSTDDLTRSFAYFTNAVQDLIDKRDMYWCRFCDRGCSSPQHVMCLILYSTTTSTSTCSCCLTTSYKPHIFPFCVFSTHTLSL
jgi:hypothetical protein